MVSSVPLFLVFEFLTATWTVTTVYLRQLSMSAFFNIFFAPLFSRSRHLLHVWYLVWYFAFFCYYCPAMLLPPLATTT